MKSSPYTTIHHSFKVQLGLNDSEYCIIDLIYQYSTNTRGPRPGWCVMRKEKMRHIFGYPRRTLTRYISNLVARGLVERSQSDMFLRTTLYYNQLRSEYFEQLPEMDFSYRHLSNYDRGKVYEVYENEYNVNTMMNLLKDEVERINMKFKSIDPGQLNTALSEFKDTCLTGKYGKELSLKKMVNRYELFLNRFFHSNKKFLPYKNLAPDN